ncbi:hypothetical protein BpHYR1_001407 [Brachionus plicatilis]|uniref:Uncharacterized protein n=1 Tax=Brachionus plicatilis TaxID=10195 RepID=A0A3M7RWI9_BRAPC|nr:hypothetical protein BpHYR1_001407 [Brachionus plicatilis]
MNRNFKLRENVTPRSFSVLTKASALLDSSSPITVRSILKVKYDYPSNIMHLEAFNKLKLLTVSNRLFELNERYVRAGLSHSVPLVVRLVEEEREGFESRYIEYPTPLLAYR